MNTDYIVEEIRKIRDEQAAKNNYDIKLILADAQKRQKQSNHPIVSFVQKKKSA
jgi:hypothetical protein